MNKILLFLIGFILVSVSQAQTVTIEDLKDFYFENKCMEYEFIRKEKSFHNDDTLISEGRVLLKKYYIDSILNFEYNIRLKNGNIYTKDKTQRHAYIKDINHFIKGNDSNGYYDTYEHDALNETFNASMYVNLSSNFENSNKYFYYEKDTVYNGKLCLKTVFMLPFEGFEGHLKSVFFIEKSTKKILKSITFFNLLNVVSYEEMKFLKVNFIEDISEDSFGRKVFKNINKPPINRDSLIEEINKDTNTFSIDKVAKPIIGKMGSKSFNIDTLKTETPVLILDLWYMACPPCIKSIPVLNEIEKKYSSKGVKVIGINNYDFKKDTETVNKFIKRMNIEYEVILVNDEEFSQMEVHAFPTLLILDSKRNVRYIKQGYTDDMKEKVEEELNKILKE